VLTSLNICYTDTPEEFKAKLRLLFAEIKTNPDAYVEEMTIDKAAGTIRRTVFIKGEKKRDSGIIPLNTEIELVGPDGRTVKVYVVISGS